MTGATDKLSPPDIDRNVLTTLAQRSGVHAMFEVWPEIDSSQLELLRRPTAMLVHGLTLVTDHQTAGRGRLTRSWVTNPGEAVMFSTVLRMPQEQRRLLPLMAGIAAVRVLRTTDSSISLKWPNDIVHMIDGTIHKVGGIIAGAHQDDSSVVVLGVGINLQLSGERPSPAAAAVADFVSTLPARAEVIVGILHELHRQKYATSDAVLAEYRDICSSLHRLVRISETAGGVTVGIAVDIDDSGRLLIETESGQRAFDAGDVEYATVSQ